MSTRAQQRLSASSLVLLAVGFIVAVVLSNAIFKGLQIDLTENRLYTLSEGSENIAANIAEPINLYLFYSDRATESVPSLRDYANRVRELLQEFVDASGGMLSLSVIDPLPFSEEEDQAAQFGLQGVQLAASPDPVYLGLAATNSVGDEEIIAFFQPDREASLEYDIAKLVSSLSDAERTVVGLVSGVSMSGQFDPRTQRMQPGWVIHQQAGQLFEIRDIGTSFDVVPEDVSLLWIVQPKDLAAETQYAIDQFVLGGGNALIFVDPIAAIDAAVEEGMPQGMPPTGQASDLPLLFDGWGIEFDTQSVVADAELALTVSSGLGGRPSRHYGYLGIGADGLNRDDLTTTELGTVNAAMAGHLSIKEGSGLTLEPLLSSSASSSALPATRFSFLPDPAALQRDFVAGGERLIVGGRISGKLKSAFPDGPPVGEDDESDAESGADTHATEHLAEAPDDANLIVVADVDILGDPMWAQVQDFFGQQIATAFASNGAFVVNALENLAGSSDLISVRSRGTFSRPFTTVEKLRARAESEYLQTQQRLEQELSDTEQRLAELQSVREDSGSLLLSNEQQAEIDRFINQRAEIRKELRAVQRGLDRDIERLGTILKVINIGLVPLLITIGTVLVIWRRRRRERV